MARTCANRLSPEPPLTATVRISASGSPHGADALRGVRQAGGGAGGEGAQGLGVVEFADPAEAAAARGVGRVGHEGAGDAQVQGAA